jgi:hypothetical protein
MGRIGCPETSVRNYHYSLRKKNTKERSSHLLRGGSLKSRIILQFLTFLSFSERSFQTSGQRFVPKGVGCSPYKSHYDRKRRECFVIYKQFHWYFWRKTLLPKVLHTLCNVPKYLCRAGNHLPAVVFLTERILAAQPILHIAECQILKYGFGFY